jgi:hypothetical protein
MPPQVIQLAFFVLQEAIRIEPALAEDIRALLSKTDPTSEDWDALRARVQGESYAELVPATALPPEPPTAAPAPAPLEAVAPAPAVFTGQAVDPHA